MGNQEKKPELKVVNMEDSDKNKALEAALGQIERTYGKGSIMKLGENNVVEIESISTGSLGLDIALGIGGLPKGRVVEIYGPEGSGKTTFIKGILRGLKYTKPVTSPTFTLVNEYDAMFPVIHIDCYREENLNRWINIGFHDYINGENIVLIEWADIISDLLDDSVIHIHFSRLKNNSDSRQINISGIQFNV